MADIYNAILSSDSDDNFSLPKQIYQRNEIFHVYTDEEFRNRYRLNKESTLIILEEIEDLIEYRSDRSILRPSFKIYKSSVYSVERVLPFNTSRKLNSETYSEKNEKLKRPLSPHLTIYKLQVTSVLSITHRATGLALSGGLYALSIGTLALSTPFPHYFEYLQTLHIAAPLIYTLKFALAWSVFYHSANGIRHLVWDMGYGYDLKTLYTSGYIVLGVSLLASAIAASI